jgi:hypothetical protein
LFVILLYFTNLKCQSLLKYFISFFSVWRFSRLPDSIALSLPWIFGSGLCTFPHLDSPANTLCSVVCSPGYSEWSGSYRLIDTRMY